jgi:hypothetical protein
MVNRESRGALKYAGVNVLTLRGAVWGCSSISTLEWAWNILPWGEKDDDGNVMDQAWFCKEVAQTNKLELLKWAREVKHCEWDEWTIEAAAAIGNLEMFKYCFSNGCPCDEEKSCEQAVCEGNLDCLRFLFDKVRPSRDMEEDTAISAARYGHTDILKYFVKERKISEYLKFNYLVATAARNGQLDCLKYFVEEAKAPRNDFFYIACARYFKHPECENYLLEKGCPEPTDEQYAFIFKQFQSRQ